MAKRLTLYYQLERIAGGSLVKLYNVVNGCCSASSPVRWSRSPLRPWAFRLDITFDVPDDMFGLSNPSFTALVVIVGVVIAVVAAAGYETVARVANIAAPWMIAVFAACGIVSLAQMEATSIVGTLAKASSGATRSRLCKSEEGRKQFGFWQIVVFAWLCNGAMHFGMADLSIFRFARSQAVRMGTSDRHVPRPLHGVDRRRFVAGGSDQAVRKITPRNPGLLAWGALGWTGIICVVIAGWTTANPTIYRAGLAFQGVLPKSPRTAMTLVAGAVATIAGAFPNLSAKLLGFVGTYGTVLGPMGAVIFVDYYLMKKFGLRDEYAAKTGQTVNVAVLVAWLLPVAVGLYLIFERDLFAAYAVIPCWIACGVIYLGLSKAIQKPVRPAANL